MAFTNQLACNYMLCRASEFWCGTPTWRLWRHNCVLDHVTWDTATIKLLCRYYILSLFTSCCRMKTKVHKQQKSFFAPKQYNTVTVSCRTCALHTTYLMSCTIASRVTPGRHWSFYRNKSSVHAYPIWCIVPPGLAEVLERGPRTLCLFAWWRCIFARRHVLVWTKLHLRLRSTRFLRSNVILLYFFRRNSIPTEFSAGKLIAHASQTSVHVFRFEAFFLDLYIFHVLEVV